VAARAKSLFQARLSRKTNCLAGRWEVLVLGVLTQGAVLVKLLSIPGNAQKKSATAGMAFHEMRNFFADRMEFGQNGRDPGNEVDVK
jgi:hypothetical protein